MTGIETNSSSPTIHSTLPSYETQQTISENKSKSTNFASYVFPFFQLDYYSPPSALYMAEERSALVLSGSVSSGSHLLHCQLWYRSRVTIQVLGHSRSIKWLVGKAMDGHYGFPFLCLNPSCSVKKPGNSRRGHKVWALQLLSFG